MNVIEKMFFIVMILLALVLVGLVIPVIVRALDGLVVVISPEVAMFVTGLLVGAAVGALIGEVKQK